MKEKDYDYSPFNNNNFQINEETLLKKHEEKAEKLIEDSNNIVKQICLGLKEIHKLNIIHRDLKPENIFINKNNLRIKIGDFGISINSIYAFSYKGTFKYMSPEMRKGSKYSNKADEPAGPEQFIHAYSTGIYLSVDQSNQQNNEQNSCKQSHPV